VQAVKIYTIVHDKIKSPKLLEPTNEQSITLFVCVTINVINTRETLLLAMSLIGDPPFTSVQEQKRQQNRKNILLGKS